MTEINHTGFPSPAESYIEQNLNLNHYLIKHPSSTYFAKYAGKSKYGLQSGDILIIDKGASVQSNSLVLAIEESEFTVKKYSENPTEIWGIITTIIHHV